MLIAPVPDNEEARLKALESYQLLDTGAESEFDELTQLAAYICKTPTALISLIDPKRQWFKSRVGLDAPETPRDVAFCAHAIHGDRIFEVQDTLQDERFKDNPLVTDSPNIRFYAGAPLITPDGYALGTLCVIGYHPRSLSMRQRAVLLSLANAVVTQMELRKKNLELERVNQFRSDFISYVSHELRTPLNAVITFADMLNEDVTALNASEEVKERLSYIRYSGERILNTVNSVLELNRIEAGKMKVNLEPVLTGTFFGRIKAIAQALADKADVTLSFNLADGMPEVLVLDEDKIAQISMNLISNAVKFSLNQGRVDVHVHYVTNELSLVVRDQGVGISEEDQQQLFKKYHRLDQTSSIQGTGLGLSICKGLVDLLKGKIHLSSQLGKGTLVKINVPADVSSSDKLPGLSSVSDQLNVSPDSRILVVEDNAVNQVVVHSMFDKLGLNIDIADSGEQCLEILAQHDYDIIFMDIRMPGINGLETTAKIRKAQKIIPVVALTADVIVDDTAFSKVGIEHVLTKPMNQNSLVRILNHYLG